jgi:hypothetical protein
MPKETADSEQSMIPIEDLFQIRGLLQYIVLEQNLPDQLLKIVGSRVDFALSEERKEVIQRTLEEFVEAFEAYRAYSKGNRPFYGEILQRTENELAKDYPGTPLLE